KRLRNLTEQKSDLFDVSRDGARLALGFDGLLREGDATKVQIMSYPAGEQLAEISTKEFAESDSLSRRYIFSPDAHLLGLVAHGKTTWGCGTGGGGVWFGSSYRARMELRSVVDGRCLVRRDYPCGVSFLGANYVYMVFSPENTKAITYGSWPAIRV